MSEMLSCTFRASRRLAALTLGLHSLAALSVALADIGWPLQLGGLGLIAVSAIRALRRRPPIRLRCLADGSLLMAEDTGDWRSVEIEAGSLVSPLGTLLRLRGDGHARAVVVLADSLTEEEFRRLRVWLRWQAAGPGASPRPATGRPGPRP